ncbi:MAG: GAF domain-containing sensor histidine kinase [Candidatus Odinarchaeota archaeon]
MAIITNHEKLLTSIFVSNPLPIIISKLNDGTIVEVNEAFASTINVTREKLIGKTLEKLGLIIEGERNGLIQRLQNQEPNSKLEFKYRDKTGKVHFFQLHSKIISVDDEKLLLSTVIDINDHKSTEKALRKRLQYEETHAASSKVLLSNLKPKRVLPKVLGYLQEASGADRVYIYENFEDPVAGLCMRQLFEVVNEGIASTIDEPMLQQLPYSSVSPELLNNLSNAKPYAGLTGEFSDRVQEKYREQGIQSILVLPTFVEGKWYGFIGFESMKKAKKWSKEDINLLSTSSEMIGAYYERKFAELKLKRQKEELSEFAHAMSHDLRNYLQAIGGYADLLDDGSNTEQVDQIKQRVDTINEILAQSIELADAGLIVDNEKAREIDLTKLVSEVAELTIPPEINFSCDDLPIVSGDPKKLHQVFKNLFDNAVKHGNPENISIKSRTYNTGMRLYVKNDGVPIPAEKRQRIFDKRFTKSKHDGSGGLGLVIVKKIIEAHGWEIDLIKKTSETNFRIIIPRDEHLNSFHT